MLQLLEITKNSRCLISFSSCFPLSPRVGGGEASRLSCRSRSKRGRGAAATPRLPPPTSGARGAAARRTAETGGRAAAKQPTAQPRTASSEHGEHGGLKPQGGVWRGEGGAAGQPRGAAAQVLPELPRGVTASREGERYRYFFVYEDICA